MNEYRKLPVFIGPTMLPPDRMKHIVDNIRPNMHYCGLSFLSKLQAWCHYIRQLDDEAAKNQFAAADASGNLTCGNLTSGNLTSGNRHLGAGTPSEPGRFGVCYDAFFCDSQWLAPTVHAIIILMAVISFWGVVGNLLCVPWFNGSSNRTGCTLYLTIMVIMDIIYIGFVWLLFIVQGLSREFASQLRLYQDWTSTILPYAVPLMEYFNVISVWLLVAVLVDRFGYLTLIENRQRSKASRCRYLIYTVVMMVVFALYSAPKCLEYSSIKDCQTGKGKVMQFLIEFKPYRIIMLNFLKPTLEILLPSLLILWYALLTKHRQYIIQKREKANVSSKLDLLACLPKHNETMNTGLVIWLCPFVVIGLMMRATVHFVSLNGAKDTEVQEMFHYGGLFVSVLVVCLKPCVYLFTNSCRLTVSRVGLDDSSDSQEQHSLA